MQLKQTCVSLRKGNVRGSRAVLEDEGEEQMAGGEEWQVEVGSGEGEEQEDEEPVEEAISLYLEWEVSVAMELEVEGE